MRLCLARSSNARCGLFKTWKPATLSGRMAIAHTPAPANQPLFGAVFARLKPLMSELDSFLAEQILQFEPEIRSMADYCIDTSGKRIRPALVFISGWQGEDVIDPALIKAAAVVELVHLASLVHDDIMDSADLRRNRHTASREFGAAAAVLLGDALFAHALHLASQYPTTEVCLDVSASVRRVCAGEIMQTLRRGTTTVTREDYRRMIDLKTAELFRLSCQLGARLTGQPSEIVQAAAEFGHRLGIAYQMYDDLADYYGDPGRIGKTLGTDLQSGKITLPLFLLRDDLVGAEREDLEREIRGEMKPRLELRLKQMRERGVYERVVEAIEDELKAASAAVGRHPEYRSGPVLEELSNVLRMQVLALGQK